MKKITLFILSVILFVLFIVGCVSKIHGSINKNYVSSSHDYKSIETLKDSKGRPHRVVVFINHGVCAIDLDANTYK